MKRSEILRFIILRTIGNFLVLFAIFGILATFGPALYYEVSLRIAQTRGVKYIVMAAETTHLIKPTSTPIPGQLIPKISPTLTPSPTPKKDTGGIANFAQVLTGPKQQVLTPVDLNFSIIIPSIGASARVYPEVDPSNPNTFLPILQKGVAHAKGTALPGQKGNVYLFAHSTDSFWDVGRYNAVFYLLKDVKKGDEIVIFYQGKRHNYIVTGSKIINPNDVSYIVDAKKQNAEQLILQTCWPPGTTFQRLLVFARPK